MLKAGFGSADITPPLGCFLQGYFRPRVSGRVHDPLFANAVVVENGRDKVCIVSCDLIGIGRREAVEARRLAGEKAGISEDNIIICGTHTHTGPAVIGNILPGLEERREEKWLALLPSMICSAVVQAAGSAEETGFACLSGREEGVSFNRRFLMKDGTVKTNPGAGNPDIVGPAGPIDPEIGLVAFGSDFFSPDGLIVNFALHLDTVGGTDISADYPGVMRNLLRGVFGDIGFVYTSGAMGNINHRNVKDHLRKYEYFEHATRIGGVLAGEIVKTLCRMEDFSADAELGGGRAEVKLPLKDYDSGALKRAEQTLSAAQADMNSREYMSSVALLRAAALGGGEYTAEIAAVRIGDAAFVSVPGEYFVELGLEIKQNSPFGKTFVVELGLDYLGYISTEEAYGQWGYEPASSPLAPGCGEILREAAVKLLGSIK